MAISPCLRTDSDSGSSIGQPRKPFLSGGGNGSSDRLSSVNRGAAWTLLVLFAALIVAERWHTRDEPVETDLGIYAVIGHGLLEGRFLYADLWDRKPPAIHLTYAAAEVLAGYGPQSILLLNVAAALATMLGAYKAGSACGFGYVGGLAAAGFWTIVGGD